LAEEEFAMTCALEGNRDPVYRALELDPYTRSTDQMAQYVKALAEVNKEYLPWLS
jgi:alpha-galactosidase/6-phospho-beta-glucosidase family protein